MTCALAEICGGCQYRQLPQTEYQNLKQQNFVAILQGLKQQNYVLHQPRFMADGTRRRAAMAFEFKQKKLTLGFNQQATHQIIDVEACPLLTVGLNAVLPAIRRLLTDLCSESYTVKRNKKILTEHWQKGDILLCEADNGIDVVLECAQSLELVHRMIISENLTAASSVIRVSYRQQNAQEAETIVEKVRPTVKMGQYDVVIPAGTFLQPSREGQQALTELVLQACQGLQGRVADLFCGVGTFSYAFASNSGVQVVAVDSSEALLKGFRESVNRNRITNVQIEQKNLFKYPPTEAELGRFQVVVFDPPRAGAKELCRVLAAAAPENKPTVLVAVSCSPQTFVNDANVLVEGGYQLEEITMVDQFSYSNHSELVARFTKV